MATPWMLGFLLFSAGPMIAALVLSFTRWDIIGEPEFVGLQNYWTMLTDDELVVKSAGVTVAYTLMAVPLHVVLGFVLAALLNVDVPGRNTFRAVFYLPTVLPLVASAVLWTWILNPEFGLVNYALSLVGIVGPGWLTSDVWALPAIVLMNLTFVGPTMVIMLAGLQRTPRELQDAAQIDGADRWAMLRFITIPLMSPVIFFAIIININQSFQTFTQAYVMTNGGPENATLFYMLHLYNNAFRFFKMGYANAMALMLFLVMIGITLVQFRLARLWVHADGADS